MADLLLTLLVIGVLSVLQHWYRLNKALKICQEDTRVRRIKARGTAFANNYRVWKWVYREILDIRGR
ncbi:TPA: hypothetical protein OUC24_003902 [Enterobacter hormaechei]|uniref:hypothetical protein n=1 Tax=Enterobacter hormaechei TaxID=158836 RepID=UPI000797F266|nr:hypothetical protein [Enterobacter hormaechei]SAB23766.1 Uncharacterised protein [Enterobacter hormaechei]SAI43639.1 Uncharacterised protein [Enterobacter hormaechei]HCT9390142.1 hypothetical protein [Enterobacter hormaechei]